jgi:hypothetical protein
MVMSLMWYLPHWLWYYWFYHRLPLPSTSWLLQALTLHAQRLGLRLQYNIAVSLLLFISVLFKPLVSLSLTQQFITAAMYLCFALSLRPDDCLRPDSLSTHRVLKLPLVLFPSVISISDVHLYSPQVLCPLRLSSSLILTANRLLTMRLC